MEWRSEAPTCAGLASCPQCRHAGYSFAPCARFGPDCEGCPHCRSDTHWPSAEWGHGFEKAPHSARLYPSISEHFLFVPWKAFGWPQPEWCMKCSWAPWNRRALRTHSDLSDDPAVCPCGACAMARSDSNDQADARAARCACIQAFKRAKSVMYVHRCKCHVC